MLWTFLHEVSDPGFLVPDVVSDEPPLPLAMLHAQRGRIDAFRRLCKERDDLPFGPLAEYCLFVGLTVDIDRGMALFRILCAIAPLEAGVWSAQARFQSAYGDDNAALRSAAIHAELTGRPFTTPCLDDAAPPRSGTGAIRTLKGDVAINL